LTKVYEPTYSAGPVGFEASVCIPFLIGFILHYYSKCKITIAVIGLFYSHFSKDIRALRDVASPI